MPNTRLVEVVKKCMSIQEEPKSIYQKKKGGAKEYDFG